MSTPINVNENFLVNTQNVQGNQFNSQITRLEDGRFVVIWTSHNADWSDGSIVAQFYNSNGTPNGLEFSIDGGQAGRQSDASITALSDGGFVVFWMGQEGAGASITGQRFNANGSTNGNPIYINHELDGVHSGFDPKVMELSDGSYIVTYSGIGQNYDLYARRFSANGEQIGDSFIINITDPFVEWAQEITPLDDGGFVVVWTTEGGRDGSDAGVFGQIFNADGSKRAGASEGQFRINQETEGRQTHPSITTLNDGRFVVTWESGGGQDGSGVGVFARIYNSDGSTDVQEFQVNDTFNNGQWLPSVTALSDGGFVVVWSTIHDNSVLDVYGQRYDSSGQRDGDEFQINDDSYNYTYQSEDQNLPTVTALDDGQFIVSWDSLGGQDGSGSGIYSQIFSYDTDDGLHGSAPQSAESLFGDHYLLTMADFALAAYSIQNWEVTSAERLNTNDPKTGADYILQQLVGDGWDRLTASELGFPEAVVENTNSGFVNGFRNGFFVNENASAFVVRTGNALVISFRGTNDIDDGLWNSPDAGHWTYGVDGVGLGDHADLFRPLSDRINLYLENHDEIINVYVAGHSLGGAMVDAYMSGHPNTTSVSFTAVTFATPGYHVSDFGETRITNFWTDNDLIQSSDIVLATPGDDNILVDGITGGISHSMTLYREILRLAHESGVSDHYLLDVGVGDLFDYDRIITEVVHNDTGSLNPNQDLDQNPRIFTAGQGDNRLHGGTGDEILLGGNGDDTLVASRGDDLLVGGGGNDTYLFGLQAGNYIILETSGQTDNIQFIHGIEKEHLNAFFMENGDLKIIVKPDNGNEYTITIKDFSLTTNIQIENFVTSNGDIHQITELLNFQAGDDSANSFTAQLNGNIIDGGEGLDTLNMLYSQNANFNYDINLTTNIVQVRTLVSGTQARIENSVNSNFDTLISIENIISGSGDDLLIGNEEANRIEGNAGDDRVEGWGGDDLFIGGAGNDYYNGGSGNDTISYIQTTLGVNVNLGLYWPNSSAGQATGVEIGTDQLVSIRNVVGGLGDDTIIGNTFNNVIEGGDGADFLQGGQVGDGITDIDTVSFASETLGMIIDFDAETAVRSDGITDIFSEFVWAIGGSGNDHIIGSATHSNRLEGGAGADILDGGADYATNEASYASSGEAVTVNLATGQASGGDAEGDTLLHMDGLVGSAYDDRLTGDSQNNILTGGAGADILTGGAGSDIFFGGEGDDVFYLDGSDSSVFGDEGYDRVFADSSGDGINLYNMGSSSIEFAQGGSGHDYFNAINSESSVELWGGMNNDELLGGSEDDIIYGDISNYIMTITKFTQEGLAQFGDDIINGGAGNDRIEAGIGDDTIDGGTGDDSLSGWSGNDTFVFGDNFGNDVITDFHKGDIIDFTQNSQVNSMDDMTITYAGENALITTANGSVTLEGISDMTDDIFILYIDAAGGGGGSDGVV